MTFGSLFSGIGGLDRGLERAGLKCRWQLEIDDYCCRVLAKHWPEVKRYGDIRNVHGNELEPVDLICGGFPCQDLSQAGKRVGIEGSRSGLWFEFSRLVGELGPRYVLVENVPGLLVYDGMRRVVGELARFGYVGCWRSLRAADFGASHLRKRVFIVAYRHEAGSGEFRRGGLFDEERQARGYDADGCHAPLAHSAAARSDGTERQEQRIQRQPLLPARSLDGIGTLGNAERTRWSAAGIRRDLDAGGEPETGCGDLADSAGNDGGRGIPEDYRRNLQRNAARQCDAGGNGNLLRFAPGPGDPRWPYILRERPDLAPALAHPGHNERHTGRCNPVQEGPSQQGHPARGVSAPYGIPDDREVALESPLRGVADGLSDWLDRSMSNRTKRLGRLGNAVVPDCAEWIGQRILAADEVLP